jgi:hypothetical protein
VKQYKWLLVMPLVISLSSETWNDTFNQLKLTNNGWVCEKDNESCLDWATALNEAHERRIHPTSVSSCGLGCVLISSTACACKD